MIILSHRGYWHDPIEKNSNTAFLNSFNYHFGTETDIRDHNGALVISHDIPDKTALQLSDFLKIYHFYELPLALNIKSDGLAHLLKKTMQVTHQFNWFVFDMSIPDIRSYIELDVPFYTRLSEVEKTPAWLEHAQGVWLDAFFNTWYTSADIEQLLLQGKKVCVVSDELHGRNKNKQWNLLKPLSQHKNLSICTDHPQSARDFFKDTA